MNKILVISPIPTHRATAGNRARVAALTRSLQSLGHFVHFMYVEQEPGDHEAMRAYWGDRLVVVPYRKKLSHCRTFHRRVARKLRHESAFCYGIDEWYDPGIDEHIDRFLASHQVDAVIVEYVFFSRALLRVPSGIVRVIDTHDVFADRHRRYLEHDMTPTWYSCTRREEAKGLARADTVIAIQESEATHFRSLTSTVVVTIGHPIELRAMPESRIVPGRILMVGSDNVINVRSLEWFAREVLPLVRQSCPVADLAVAGTLGNRLPDAPGLRALGRIDDLGDAYAEAQVVVNPMQFGTGLKIKSVEALGYARALVTTPCGAEGLEPGSGAAFRVAADPGEFARLVTTLLRDPAAAESLARAGHEFARNLNSGMLAALSELFPPDPREGSRKLNRP